MELLRALATLAEPPSVEQAGLLRLLDLPGEPTEAAWSDTFLFQLYPYASVYVGAEGMLGGEARDRVAGFFRALDVTPPAEPDHLAVLLAAQADLADREAEARDGDTAASWRRARTALLWEHLLPWLPPYLARVAEVAAEPYRSWAPLLLDVLRQEAGQVGGPSQLPLHLRDAPGLPDPRDGDVSGFLAGLLAPVRTGTIILRDDLARACRELGLGLRMGERRFVLRAMLDQDAPATLAWLADHARHTHRHADGWLGPVGAWWHERAAATSSLLGDLANDVLHHDDGSLVLERG